eukprot:gene8132-9254_t
MPTPPEPRPPPAAAPSDAAAPARRATPSFAAEAARRPHAGGMLTKRWPNAGRPPAAVSPQRAGAEGRRRTTPSKCAAAAPPIVVAPPPADGGLWPSAPNPKGGAGLLGGPEDAGVYSSIVVKSPRGQRTHGGFPGVTPPTEGGGPAGTWACPTISVRVPSALGTASAEATEDEEEEACVAADAPPAPPHTVDADDERAEAAQGVRDYRRQQGRLVTMLGEETGFLRGIVDDASELLEEKRRENAAPQLQYGSPQAICADLGVTSAAMRKHAELREFGGVSAEVMRQRQEAGEEPPELEPPPEVGRSTTTVELVPNRPGTVVLEK